MYQLKPSETAVSRDCTCSDSQCCFPVAVAPVHDKYKLWDPCQHLLGLWERRKHVCGLGWGGGVWRVMTAVYSMCLCKAPVSALRQCSKYTLCTSQPTVYYMLLQEVASIDKQLAVIALGRFKSCVRTSLLLCDGYECQEKEGTFLVAFSSPRAAVEWALTLQLTLLKSANTAMLNHAVLCYAVHARPHYIGLATPLHAMSCQAMLTQVVPGCVISL